MDLSVQFDKRRHVDRLAVRRTDHGRGQEHGRSDVESPSISDGVWMYQMTDKGLSAEITAKSTNYKGNNLN